jgi:hypothetical protein
MMAKRWLSDNKSRKVYTLTVDSEAERRAKSCIVDALSPNRLKKKLKKMDMLKKTDMLREKKSLTGRQNDKASYALLAPTRS